MIPVGYVGPDLGYWNLPIQPSEMDWKHNKPVLQEPKDNQQEAPGPACCLDSLQVPKDRQCSARIAVLPAGQPQHSNTTHDATQQPVGVCLLFCHLAGADGHP
jgi:hypothetical protein